MRFVFVAMVLSGSCSQAMSSSPEPRLELGIGAVALSLPDYRGSDQTSARLLPIPYVAYRSERLQITREGLRARLFAGERFSLGLSAAANLPGDADDNPLRAGMPELDPTFEIGPSLDLRLHDDAQASYKFRLRLPVRTVLATDGRQFESAGWVVNPHLRADFFQSNKRWEVSHFASLGPMWATSDYHNYYYGVAPQFALGAYDASAGYSGTRLSVSSALERARWRFGFFASYDWLRGATFDESPLLATEHSVVSGIYFTYRLYQSGVASPGLGTESP